ncbi:Eco57I restriction-modification methylase domain-containing protein [Candidatus Harpocratesius sp.]
MEEFKTIWHEWQEHFQISSSLSEYDDSVNNRSFRFFLIIIILLKVEIISYKNKKILSNVAYLLHIFQELLKQLGEDPSDFRDLLYPLITRKKKVDNLENSEKTEKLIRSYNSDKLLIFYQKLQQQVKKNSLHALFSYYYQCFLEDRHNQGNFFTPSWLVKFHLKQLVNIISQHYGKSTQTLKIADISCGTGIFLLESCSYFSSHEIYGFDLDPLAVELCRLNLLLKQKSFLIQDCSKLEQEPQISSKSIRSSNFRSWKISYQDSIKDPIIPKKFHLLIGNPPWGISLEPYKHLFSLHFPFLLRNSIKSTKNITYSKFSNNRHKISSYFIREQVDSAALFLCRNLQLLIKDGICSLILPSNLLLNPSYEAFRANILSHYSLLQICYLGENIFPEVTLPSMILTIQNRKVSSNHMIEIIQIEAPNFSSPNLDELQPKILQKYLISQYSFQNNPFSNFTIFLHSQNNEIIRKIQQNSIYRVGDFLKNSRGVELGKKGKICKCPHCSKWNPLPLFLKRAKDGQKIAKCNNCGKYYKKDQIRKHKQIIFQTDAKNSDKFLTDSKHPVRPLLVGESIRKFSLQLNHKIILGYPGIKYKSTEIYKPPKILLRKTGRGIIGAIDYKSRYTLQVVYQFIQKSNLFNKKKSIYSNQLVNNQSISHNLSILSEFSDKKPLSTGKSNFPPFTLEFLFAIITSKMMEFYYFNVFANPKKKAFPHLLQANILALPIPFIDLNDPKSKFSQLYHQIVSSVRQLNFEWINQIKLDVKEFSQKDLIDSINDAVMKIYCLNSHDQEIIRSFKI